jgi:hypothetical protein
MSELEDVIQESVEHGKESKLNSFIAVFVAITATFMAICNIKGGNIVQNMSKFESKTVNSWSYFQAKSTKQSITESTYELLKNQKTTDLELLKKYQTKIERYENEKEEIKKEAESFQKAYDDLNIFDDQFDMTEAFLSIAIAIAGLSALTQKKQLFFFACTLSLIGFALGITAFMGIAMHSDFISNILG